MNCSFYLDETERKNKSYQLFICSYELFRGASIVKNFDQFRAVQNLYGDINYEILEVFIKTILIDQFLIVMMVENYLKATLIQDGYLVHEPKDKSLLKQQKVAPLSLASFSENCNLESMDSCLKVNRTIGISTLLEYADKDFFNDFPQAIVDLSKTMQEVRNSLHFLDHYEVSYSPEIIIQISETIRFFSSIAYQFSNQK